jgi:hypothetical protein
MMIEDEEEYLTQEITITRECFEDSEPEALKLIESNTQEFYGLSYEEYIELRNSLVRQYNYKLPISVFQMALIKKITIDLVARKYLAIDITPTSMSYSITDKGYDAITQNIANGKINPETENYAALLELRNQNLLED